MRISDWSSDVCSSDLADAGGSIAPPRARLVREGWRTAAAAQIQPDLDRPPRRSARSGGGADHRERQDCRAVDPCRAVDQRSEEHTSELQSLMRISYAVFCLKNTQNNPTLVQELIIE